MSEKLVKITNGKVLTLNITKEGYKSVIKSFPITENKTINVQMIPETSADGVYSLGDRLGNIASFVCYYNAVDEGVAKTYAVFVADSEYRNNDIGSASVGFDADNILTHYDTAPTQQGLNSATYCTNAILNNYGADAYKKFDYVRRPIIEGVQQPLTLTIGGNIYQTQVPNCFELQAIYDNRVALDTAETNAGKTIVSGKDLTNWLGVGNSFAIFSCNFDTNKMWCHTSNRIFSNGYTSTFIGAIPIFEIPVN